MKKQLKISEDKSIEIFCTTDEFCKKFDEEVVKKLLSSTGKARRRRPASLSDNIIMTILLMFHFGTFDKFKQINTSVCDKNLPLSFLSNLYSFRIEMSKVILFIGIPNMIYRRY